VTGKRHLLYSSLGRKRPGGNGQIIGIGLRTVRGECNVEGECHARCGPKRPPRDHMMRCPKPPTAGPRFLDRHPQRFPLFRAVEPEPHLYRSPSSTPPCVPVKYSLLRCLATRIASLAVLCLKFLMLTTHSFPRFLSLRGATVYQCALYRCHHIFLSPLKIMSLYLFGLYFHYHPPHFLTQIFHALS
jgi:hypothetical protein